MDSPRESLTRGTNKMTELDQEIEEALTTTEKSSIPPPEDEKQEIKTDVKPEDEKKHWTEEEDEEQNFQNESDDPGYETVNVDVDWDDKMAEDLFL